MPPTSSPDILPDFENVCCTWSATVYAGVILARSGLLLKQSSSSRRKVVTAAVKEVAELMGNTPAVCRSVYIDPRVIDHFNDGQAIATSLHGDHNMPPPRSVAAEKAIFEMLRLETTVAA